MNRQKMMNGWGGGMGLIDRLDRQVYMIYHIDVIDRFYIIIEGDRIDELFGFQRMKEVRALL